MSADLSYLTKEELLALVAEQHHVNAEQRKVIAQLQQRIAALEQQLKGRSDGSSGMPGNKPATTRWQTRKAARQQRAQNMARPRTETPTEQVDHAVDVCPDCGTALRGGWVQRTREVLDVPLAPVRVIVHRFITRVCPRCNQRRSPPATVLREVAVGKQRLGVGLVSLIATLRTEARLPLATIQALLATLYHLKLSVGGITAALHALARAAQPRVHTIRDRIRASPVVHADETGWREEGKNGYVWTFSTPTERYFVRGGRGKGMLDDALGPTFQGVLVSDFYAA